LKQLVRALAREGAMNTYPNLLNSKAQIVSTLNRLDLVMLAVSYLVLSKLKISGFLIFAILLIGLLIKKSIDKKLNFGFFKFLISKRVVSWRLK